MRPKRERYGETVKLFWYPPNDQLHPNGGVQAVEVARFPSGNAIFRWFDQTDPKLYFDLVRNPDADEVKNMDPLAGIKLAFLGDTLIHMSYHQEPDIYDLGGEPCFGELKWFSRYVGAPIHGRRVGRKRSVGRTNWKKIEETPASTMALDEEEIEVYRMLGEPLPILWDDEAFIRWAEERFSGT